jgi:hypothetical protein
LQVEHDRTPENRRANHSDEMIGSANGASLAGGGIITSLKVAVKK